MKKVSLTFLCFSLLAVSGYAQNKTFGIGTSTLNSNAALQVDATNQGLQLPRLTTTQRTGMTLSATDKGLMVFDTDLNSIHTWNGTGWSNGATAQKFVIPYKDSVLTTMPTGTRLLALKYNGTSDIGIAQFQNHYTGNKWPVVAGLQKGLGFAGSFVVDNVNNTASALSATTNSNVDFSPAFIATSTGTTNSAGGFYITDPTNNFSTVYGETAGLGTAGVFRNTNSTNTSTALYGESIGLGSGVAGWNNGTGSGGYFAKYGTGNYVALGAESFITTAGAGLYRINNTSNDQAALYTETNGIGYGLIANHIGSTGDIAVFQSGGANKARIDKAGIGYFNGGTQNSGADVAEMFDIEGDRQNYEPGDVLVISESTDRTVEKSFSSSSTKVAGVYATKPGVTLTEKGIEENLDDLVPMGVIGVIPTKVCDENGPIKRGDLLVTSSISGHAMKAKPVLVNGVEIYPAGAILGKALENWEAGKGLIKVLVNVK